MWREVLAAAVAVGAAPAPGPQQAAPPAAVPPECLELATCASAGKADWGEFRARLQRAVAAEDASPHSAMEEYFRLMEAYALDAGVALECRMWEAPRPACAWRRAPRGRGCHERRTCL
ncbi:unnamed protein product [Prorocentrum cordatum]|uniref:Uncharacterized protein n=1 Tax=Prorocentrum cordatum TaxID=2364126 RepID=A0ABN9T6B2_9DINO|nr:unnamed protein product [Polarella glacialis]